MSEDRATYEVPGRTEIRHGCRLPFANPGYLKPTTDEIRAVLRMGNLTGSAAGRLLGVNGRTVRKWTGGESDMPYSAWRLLLIHNGLALDAEVCKAADA